MAKRSKPTTPKRQDSPIVIHIDIWKVPTGHRTKACRTGAHADRRHKRNRTRAAQQRHATQDHLSQETKHE